MSSNTKVVLMRWAKNLLFGCMASYVAMNFLDLPLPVSSKVMISLLIVVAIGAVLLFWRVSNRLFSQADSKPLQLSRPSTKIEPRGAVYLLSLLIPSNEDKDCIIGDLIEEYAQFQSRAAAYIWIYKQVFRSATSLVYKNIKYRLVSYVRK